MTCRTGRLVKTGPNTDRDTRCEKLLSVPRFAPCRADLTRKAGSSSSRIARENLHTGIERTSGQAMRCPQQLVACWYRLPCRTHRSPRSGEVTQKDDPKRHRRGQQTTAQPPRTRSKTAANVGWDTLAQRAKADQFITAHAKRQRTAQARVQGLRIGRESMLLA